MISAIFVSLAPSAPVSAASGDALDITSVDTTEFPDVALRVQVAGIAALDDLSTSSFEVREDGDVRRVTDVQTAEAGDLEVLVVFDRSGSMAGEPIAAAKRAVTNFVDRLPAEVTVGLVSFSSRAALDVAPTLDRAAVRAGIDALSASGRTALYDGLFVAGDSFSGTKSRRLLVVLSDGGDNASIASLADAQARTAGAVVEVIELATPESNRPALDLLVDPGPVRSVSSPADLDSVYGAVVDQLLSQVIVTYESLANEDADDIRVQLRLAGATGASGSSSAKFAVPSSTGSTETTTGGVSIEREAPGVLVGAVLVVGGVVLVLFGLLVRRRGLANRLPEPITVSWTAATVHSARKPWFRWLDGPRGTQLATLLRNAGVSTPVEQFVTAVTAATLGSIVVLALLVGPLAVVGIGVPWAVRSVLRSRAKDRRTKFITQLPDTLQVLASMLRSGYGLVQAIDAVARESDDPTNVWFERVLLEVRTGRDLGQALKALADEVQSVDFDWVVVAVEINRDVGGEMARTLESVAETVRERDRLRGQVQALTAEGRMSAYLMLALPPLTAGATLLLNPEFGKVLLEPVGFVLIGIAAMFMAAGWFWITRLIDKVAG